MKTRIVALCILLASLALLHTGSLLVLVWQGAWISQHWVAALFAIAVLVAVIAAAVAELMFNRRVRGLQEQVRQLAKMPRGDRCVVFDGRGDLAELASEINAIVAEVDKKESEVDVLSDALARVNKDLFELANTDLLTGLCNRRRLFDDMEQMLSLARRYNQSVSLCIFDVDEFKKVNGTYGHDAGDAVLKDLAVIGQAALRDSDILARVGGEEFVLLMPNTAADGAVTLCERLRRDFAARVVSMSGQDIHYTCSFGVTCYITQDDTPDSLMQRAHTSLYLAKETGRNRVIAA